MKYIPAEKLKAEIEKRLEERQDRRNSASWENEYWPESDFCAHDDEDESIIAIINSLQEEQPEVDLEREIDLQWKKCEPTDEGMGLESAYIVNEQFDYIAHHFYNLGLNARKV